MGSLSSNIVNQISGANIGGGVSGLVGLGTNRGIVQATSDQVYNPNFNDSIMGQWLGIHPTALNFSFGLALNKPIVTPKVKGSSLASIPSSAGIVNWLAPDPTAYDPNTLVYANVLSNTEDLQTSLATDPQDWVVNLNGWTLVSGSNTIKNLKQVTANVDPLYQGIYFPLDAATLIRS